MATTSKRVCKWRQLAMRDRYCCCVDFADGWGILCRTSLLQRATEARLSLPSLGPRDAVLSANTRGYRGYSRKLQDMLKQQQQLDGERGRKEQTRRERSKKFEPHNWKSLSAKQLTGMSAFERSRYMAVSVLSVPWASRSGTLTYTLI